MDGDFTISQATVEKLLPFASVISCVIALWCGDAKQRGKVLPSVTSPEGGLRQSAFVDFLPLQQEPHTLL